MNGQTLKLKNSNGQEIGTGVILPEVPTKTSQLTNDSGFITSIPSEYITETELNEKGYLTEHQDISGKANKSDIPTKTSQLTNDSGFITEVPSEYITETELNSKGLATESFVSNKIAEAQLQQGEVDLSNYQTKTDNTLTTTDKTIVGAINELDLDCIRLGDTIDDSVINVEENVLNRISTIETNKADKSSIPTSLPANGGNANTVGGFSVWVGTQTEYDAITTKSSTTLYFIREV